VIALLGVETADNGQLIGVLRELRQMFTESHPRHIRGNFLELPAVLVPGLHVERIGLARPAGHPQKDAMSSPTGVGGQLLCQRRQPTTHACSTGTASQRMQQPPAVDKIETGHRYDPFKRVLREKTFQRSMKISP
jgi:hypothetical protein